MQNFVYLCARIAQQSNQLSFSLEKCNCKFLGDYNVGRNDALLTIPLYMAFLLDLAPEDEVLEPIDTDQFTQLAKDALTDR